MAIVDEIIKPSDCFFAMCLPLTKEDFYNSLEEHCNKTYSKIRKKQLEFNREALWLQDHKPFVDLFLKKKSELEKAGVTVCINFSITEVNKIKDFKVATLLAHHDDKIKMIELFDDMHPVSKIIAGIPGDYDKILDLTMCRSVALQMEVKEKFNKCLVVANKLNTNPEFRLLCYSKAISLLAHEDMSYVDAIKKVRLLLINSTPKKK